MGLHHRKLIREICQTICHVDESGSCSSSDCEVCFKICLTNPLYPYYSPPPPPPPPSPLQAPPFSLDENANQGNHHRISTYLILTLALLAAAFFAVCIRAIYTRLGNRRAPVQEIEETHDDFLDEEHGPIVDHPIWHIRTPGLQQSIINAITVCNYKKGEGLIEGTDCSVCLSEFQEDESLRLLPKCNHAFHLHCIDTWLGSHTNCPLCRAPIVTNPTSIPSLESVVVDSSSFENTQMEILENRGETETSGGMGNRAADSELRNRVEEEGEMEVGDGERICEAESQVAEGVSIRPRRSVSLDFSSVADINLALATFLSVESGGHSKRVLGGNNYPSVSKGTGNDNLSAISRGGFSFRSARYLQGAPSSMRRTHSYNGKYLLPWYGRSQRKQNVPL